MGGERGAWLWGGCRGAQPPLPPPPPAEPYPCNGAIADAHGRRHGGSRVARMAATALKWHEAAPVHARRGAAAGLTPPLSRQGERVEEDCARPWLL